MENKFDMEAFIKGTPAIDASGTVRKVISVTDDWVTYANVSNGNRYVLVLDVLKIKANRNDWRMHVEPVKPVKPETEKRRKPNARRDSFAKAAMQSLLNGQTRDHQIAAIAAGAVHMAEAMIAELDKGPPA